ncbi:MAG TPA: hypothetical protein VKA21_11370, partial [Candidatus Binatia bacterium]|nr:hypothetical protein [Candidatus Binatia bacterium]
WLLLRAIDATADWEAFFARRAREVLLGVAANVLALVRMLFEDDAATPRLAAALASRRGLCVLHDRADVLSLVAAPAKDPTALAWFARVYPGSLFHYLVWFWWGGFPANLSRLAPALREQATLLYRRAASSSGAKR